MLREAGYILTPAYPGPADNSIDSVTEVTTATIKSMMAAEGVHWKPSNKTAGSRVYGLELVRDRLASADTHDGPALYITENCESALSLLPQLPRSKLNPDDVDTTSEDHPFDEIRYRVLAEVGITVGDLTVVFPT
jgi:hypothetical protein